jgi:predicted MFS family arabinose efflux permease
VLAAVLVGFLLFVAYGAFMTVWSLWLSAEFQLDVLAISLVATLIGVAELIGVTITGLFIDRMGKRRGSLGGVLLLAIGFALLPLTQGNLLWAKVLLIVMGGLWEYTIVAHFPLFAEQLPEARATLFALVSLGISIGLAVASPLAVGLWNASGLGAVALMSTLALVLALLVGWRWLRE